MSLSRALYSASAQVTRGLRESWPGTDADEGTRRNASGICVTSSTAMPASSSVPGNIPNATCPHSIFAGLHRTLDPVVFNIPRRHREMKAGIRNARGRLTRPQVHVEAAVDLADSHPRTSRLLKKVVTCVKQLESEIHEDGPPTAGFRGL
ncbi:hypothetical protein GMORB2_5349 [Geosmithia morbida]|uniref:Uncharacterized protein n=1 Tax=Geosmithia morbida TaxID=1094350 RepID=A0A9P5D264_9HYPO|nr:uncharacterized protein GMORB2_5349 [Geosmithia morbida]KAF4124683.1 hypothetical protein GMORB2_5349 [Geosmithia morbida]